MVCWYVQHEAASFQRTLVLIYIQTQFSNLEMEAPCS